MSWIEKDIIEPLITAKEKADGVIDDWFFDEAIYKVTRVMKLISKYIEKHGNVALLKAGEWLYEDKKGQKDGVDLVADILEELSEYAEFEDTDT